MSPKGADRWRVVHNAMKKGRPPPTFDIRSSARTDAVAEILLDRTNYTDDNGSPVFNEKPPLIAQRLTDDGGEPRVRRTRRSTSAKADRTDTGTKPVRRPLLDQEAQYRLKYERAIAEVKVVAGWNRLDTKTKLAKIGEKV